MDIQYSGKGEVARRWGLSPCLAIPTWRMAIDQTKTMCRAHRRPAPAYTSSHSLVSWLRLRHPPKTVRPPNSSRRRSVRGIVSSSPRPHRSLTGITHVRCFAVVSYKISRTTMTPPKLTRYTPILHVFHPSNPIAVRSLRLDLQLAGESALNGDQLRQKSGPSE